MTGVEVFLPRIRFKRATRQKASWVTEALFPGYLFARFDWTLSARQVNYGRGVRSIVHFGQYCPTIPEAIIRDLQTAMGSAELLTIDPALLPGDNVQITAGTLKGLRAVVSQVIPGRERVAVLMELLGQQTMIELTTSSLIKEGNERSALFSDNAAPPGMS